MPPFTKLATVAPLLIAASLAAQTHPRALSRAEIAAAIQESLDGNNLSAGPSLLPADISLTTPVTVDEQHPALAVTQIESRHGSSTTQVALWITSEPRIPPFWVAIDRRIGLPAVASKSNDAGAPNDAQSTQVRYIWRTSIHSHALAQSAAATKSPLVHAGNPIQLIVQGAGMRITSRAKALETGRAGQQIRVQTEPAGKILVAKIVTAQTAEIDY